MATLDFEGFGRLRHFVFGDEGLKDPVERHLMTRTGDGGSGGTCPNCKHAHYMPEDTCDLDDDEGDTYCDCDCYSWVEANLNEWDGLSPRIVCDES